MRADVTIRDTIIDVEFDVYYDGQEVSLDAWDQEEFPDLTKEELTEIEQQLNRHIDENITEILERLGHYSERSNEYSRNYINALNRGE